MASGARLSMSRHTIKRHTNDYTRQYACFFAVIMVIRSVIRTVLTSIYLLVLQVL
jgi:hypothetical protein